MSYSEEEWGVDTTLGADQEEGQGALMEGRDLAGEYPERGEEEAGAVVAQEE